MKMDAGAKIGGDDPPNEDAPNMLSFDDTIDLDEEHLKKLLLDAGGFQLCNNSAYQNLPLCQGRNLTFSDLFGPSTPMEPFEYAFIVELVVPIIFGIVVVVGVFGNALVVIVIIVNKQMRSTTNYLIFSLAMADLLFTLFCVPFTASDYIFSQWPFGNVWCKVVQYLTYVTAYASVYTLLLLSIDRYLAVVHPIYAISIRTQRNAIYAIVFTWTLILSSCTPLYIVHGLSDKETCKFNEDKYHHAAFHIGFITTMYFFPLAVIVILYFMILDRLWNQKGPGGTRSAESVRGKKRVTTMVVTVVVTFIICWLPIQIVLLLKSLEKYEMNTFNVFFQIFGQVLAYVNSCVNPILYAFLSDPFRKAFRKVISCGPNRKSPDPATNYEGNTHNRNPRQSLAMGTMSDTASPSINTGSKRYANAGERKQLLVTNNSIQVVPLLPRGVSTMTTSFINGSTKELEDEDDPRNPSCHCHLNTMV